MFLKNFSNYVPKQLTRTFMKTNYTAKNLPNDILLLRHAQSNYNVASTEYCHNNNIKNLSWD